MTRRDVCEVCNDEKDGHMWVDDDDPMCVICECSMHDTCAEKSSIIYKDIDTWIVNNGEYDRKDNMYDDDEIPPICPDCYKQFMKSKSCISCRVSTQEENVLYCSTCKNGTCKNCHFHEICWHCTFKSLEFRQYICKKFNVDKLNDVIKQFVTDSS